MPKTKSEKALFALITVVITVHAYVFYSLYVVNGAALMSAAGESGVIRAINALGGVYMFGRNLPIWAVVLTELAFAYGLEMCVGSPCSLRLAFKCFSPESSHPVLLETAVICATVGIMCPAMSLIAAFLYYPYHAGFRFLSLLADWLKLVCLNFPFAFFTQLFFIQPFVRTVFRLITGRRIKPVPHPPAYPPAART